ncbi:uncharacterized protein BDW43DRAFT_177281 [Aspergillus alliaceus]|uniref:uncharacterized protein n=1 Tax=Petromyces alliaceus TaxID=209559 RepID=UPI0012A6BD92|nr:uncharacterized protein BDW43DRAFT_177281 [Aspergillus alliaceus]KAB8229758.1 hypothetical protein BDW43DRAFT_177281 [Aspergillus alliaceus]
MVFSTMGYCGVEFQNLTTCFVVSTFYWAPLSLGGLHEYSLVFIFSYIIYCMLGTANHTIFPFCSNLGLVNFNCADIRLNRVLNRGLRLPEAPHQVYLLYQRDGLVNPR